MNNRKTLLIASVALFVVLLLGGAFMYFRDRLPGGNGAGDVPEGLTEGPAYISDFVVAKPNLVATGENLSKVDIWYVPSQGAEPQLLGRATLKAEAPAAPGSAASKIQTWIFPIPKQRVPAIDIFARGYNLNNTPVARIGLTDLSAVW